MDQKAAKILKSHFWGPGGWKSESITTTGNDDRDYAKSKGVMFDPIDWGHDKVIDYALEPLQFIDLRSVADSFVSSIETRELFRRSALGSFAVLRHLSPHSFSGSGMHCAWCGEYQNEENRFIDLNVLNFERVMWGGVRHLHPIYAGLDLNLFLDLPPVTPSRRAIQQLTSILDEIDSAPENISSAKLQSRLSKIFKSNKAERNILIGILGFCGILETHEHRGFLDRFVPGCEREIPSRRFVDMPYPSCWWLGSSRVNQDAVSHWFGHLLK